MRMVPASDEDPGLPMCNIAAVSSTDIGCRGIADRDVIAARGVGGKGIVADRGISVSGSIQIQRPVTHARVRATGRVELRRESAGGDIKTARRVHGERLTTSSGVVGAGGGLLQRVAAGGSVEAA